MTRRFKKSKIDTPWKETRDILPAVLSSIVNKRRSRPKNVDALWNSIVPFAYVKYTSVMKLEGDTLYIKVSSSALYSELVMVGDSEIVSRIKSLGTFPSIKRVVYRR